MKILFVISQSFNPNAGGVQRTTFILGRSFTEKGMSVAYFSFSSKSQIEPEHGRLYHATQGKGALSAANMASLAAAIEDFRPDFVINQIPYEKSVRDFLAATKPSFGYSLFACLHNSLYSFKSNIKDILSLKFPSVLKPLVTSGIVTGIAQRNHLIKQRKELTTIIDKHDRFILLTPPNRDELEYFVGKNYKQEKVIAIPNPITHFETEIKYKEKNLLHVGRINIPQKRSDLLLKVWEECHKLMPDWTFTIVGDGPYLSLLKKQLETKKLPRVVVTGFQKPEEYYRKSPLFMMPSAFEGLPNTILEAQSYGCVTFAFDSYAAVSWIVNNNKDAVLTQPFDTKAMGQSIAAVANDAKKMAVMQHNALSNIQRFTLDTITNYWCTLFNEFKSN